MVKFENFEVPSASTTTAPLSNLLRRVPTTFDSFLLLSFPSVVNLPSSAPPSSPALHGFRRFRVTHLDSSCVPPALVKYWTGHAKSGDGEVAQQPMAKDAKFCADVAERIRLGFELSKAETVEVVPKCYPE